MWTGRFQQATDALVRAYGESISFDWRLYAQDIEGSVAHAGALHAAGLLTGDERARSRPACAGSARKSRAGNSFSSPSWRTST